MAYSTHTNVRAVEPLFKCVDDFPDATIEGWISLEGDPIVDGHLGSKGFTVPITGTPPNLVILASALYSAAAGLDAYVGQSSEDVVPRAQNLRDRATEILEGIASGELHTTLARSDSGAAIVMDGDPETFPETAWAVGDETQWGFAVEDRE